MQLTVSTASPAGQQVRVMLQPEPNWAKQNRYRSLLVVPVLHPGNAVEVPQASGELCSRRGPHARAVCGPGALMSVGRCCDINVQTVI